MRTRFLLACLLILTACGGGGGEAAAEGCGGIEGETVTLVVPFSPGGGYDSYARLLAPYLEEQLGATVIVENQDGAGGLLALNNLLTAAPDGTTLVIMNGIGAGGASIAGAEGAAFALDEFSYIGRVASEPPLIVTDADSEFQTWDDVVSADSFRFGSTGPGASDFVTPSLLIEAFGLNAELVTGFEGSEENELAVTQGNVDGMSGDLDSRLPAIESGDHRPLLLIADEANDAVPDTPAVAELELEPAQEELITAHLDLLELARPIVGPPGIPDDALGCLRDGLQAALEDPELVTESEEQGRPIDYLPGEELEQVVAEILDAPAEYKRVLTEAY